MSEIRTPEWYIEGFKFLSRFKGYILHRRDYAEGMVSEWVLEYRGQPIPEYIVRYNHVTKVFELI